MDQLTVAVTFANEEGVVMYLNRASKERFSTSPRQVGLNVHDCHGKEASSKILDLFEEFRQGSRWPHHYVNCTDGTKELVYLIPVFEKDEVKGCVSQISTLDYPEPERLSQPKVQTVGKNQLFDSPRRRFHSRA